ncbi:hypothetical protein [Kribbella swartbergensis]
MGSDDVGQESGWVVCAQEVQGSGGSERCRSIAQAAAPRPRSRDGRLYRGKTGVMRVALATGAPVVPVVVTGTDQVNPPDTRRWHLGHVHLKICPPLDLSPYAGRPLTQPVVRQATDHLMRVLQSHSHQEYADVYARRAS